MDIVSDNNAQEPTRAEIDAIAEPLLLEFGASWCGYCRAAQPLIANALEQHAGIRHIRIEDGRSKRLGRSFIVKLWPTLVFLKQGREIARVVRPNSAAEIRDALVALEAAPAT
jgi:thioredoxin 1